MQSVRRIALGTLTLCLALPLLAAAVPSGAPVTLDAIVSLTGSGAFIGGEEAKSLQVVERIANDRGGIRGRPLRFAIADDQSNPSLAIQLLNGVIARRVPAVIGPAGTASCNAALPLVKDQGPVIYCLTGNVRLPANGYAFGGGIFTYDLMEPILRFFRGKGWRRIALVTSTDSAGADFERAFDFGLAHYNAGEATLVSREHFNPTDLTVAAQLQRTKTARPDVVIGWTTGSSLGTLLRGYAEAGIDLPILTSNGNIVVNQLEQYAGFMPKQLLFPGFLGMVRGAVKKGPIDDAQAAYFAALDNAPTAADVGYNIAWDPAWLEIEALRHVGPDAPASAVRDDLLKLHGYVGINGVYDFRDGLQRGIRANGSVMLRWDPVKRRYLVESGSGGAPK
jgi:branched-chain amino acid transport system substrate-binding protein